MENILKLLQFIDEAKDLVENNASHAERKDFIERVGDALLDEGLGEKHSTILKQYVEVIKDVVDPYTTTQLRGDAIKKLGLIIADKLNFEVFDDPETPEGKSAVKVISSLKSLAGAIDLIRHNEDPNDETKLSGEVMKSMVVDMLDDFDLDDDFEVMDKEVREFLESGKKLLESIKAEDGVDALEVAVRVADLLDEGYDVVRGLLNAMPDLKAMFKHIIDGTKAIAVHVKDQVEEVGGLFEEFGGRVKIIHTEHMHDRLMNKMEAEDGDGYKDGKWNEFVENTKDFGKAFAKGMGAAGHLFKDLLGFGHEDKEEAPITESEVVESNLTEVGEEDTTEEGTTTVVANDNDTVDELSDAVLPDEVVEG